MAQGVTGHASMVPIPVTVSGCRWHVTAAISGEWPRGARFPGERPGKPTGRSRVSQRGQTGRAGLRCPQVRP